jgi:hypothetical protein
VKRLALLAIYVCLVILTICSGAVAYARSRPAPALLQRKGIDTCESKPCLLGVTPGITAWNDAHTMLAQRSTSSREDRWISVELDEYTRAIVPRYKSDRTISDILISFKDTPATTVGSLITQYGPPCIVLYNRSSRGIVLRYPFMYATTFLPGRIVDVGFLDARSPLSTLTLHRDLDRCTASRLFPSDNLVYAGWIGFASLKRYVLAEVTSAGR